MVITTKRTGAWREVGNLLKNGPPVIRRGVKTQVIGMAEEIRDKIVEGIRTQAPGGKPFKPLEQDTLAARRRRRFNGPLALIGSQAENLIKSVVVKKRGGGLIVNVGVFSKKKTRRGATVYGVGEMNEYGKTIKRRLTPKMRRFLHAFFRKEGLLKEGNSKKGLMLITIPARPFIDPVVKKYGRRAAIKWKIVSWVEKQLRAAGFGPFLK